MSVLLQFYPVDGSYTTTWAWITLSAKSKRMDSAIQALNNLDDASELILSAG